MIFTHQEHHHYSTATHVKGPQDFNPSHKKVYKYEVLGGLHGTIARQELLQEDPGNEIENTTVYTVFVSNHACSHWLTELLFLKQDLKHLVKSVHQSTAGYQMSVSDWQQGKI